MPFFSRRYRYPVNGLPAEGADHFAGVNDGAVHDLDGDGRADVVIIAYKQANTAQLGQSQAWVYLSRDGGFQGPVAYAGEATDEVWPGGVLIADVNRDGVPDLLVSTASSLDVRLGAGDGTFGSEIDIPSSLGCNGGDMVQIDANSDGWPDIEEITWYCGMLTFLNDPTGPEQFFSPTEPTGAKKAGPLAVGDLNGDGWQDLAFDDGSGLAWLEGGPNGLSYAVHPLAGSGTASIATFPTGKGDALAVTSGKTLTVFAPTAAGPAAPTSYPVDIGGILTVADVNGDGASDLLIGGGDTVDVLINLGGGALSRVGSLRLPVGLHSFIQSIAAGDLDGDGAPDLAVFWGYGPWEAWINSCGPGATPADLDGGEVSDHGDRDGGAG